MNYKYIHLYPTPPGPDDLLLSGDDAYLTNVDFMRGDTSPLSAQSAPSDAPPPWLAPAVRWLDLYFSGARPSAADLPPFSLAGLSPFTRAVCGKLLLIPFGETVTYGELARELAAESPSGRMSAQAIGQAVHRNPLCIMIPCHRVLGAGGKLTGYGGGIENKKALLEWEGIKDYKE